MSASDTLSAALQMIARGFAVFPCYPNTKDPMVSHVNSAFRDPEALKRYFYANGYPDNPLNYGVCTTDLVVVDVDVKDGRNGIRSFLDLGLSFDSFTVKSPSGGYHVYYHGPDSSGVIGKLGNGIDIRSHHNYVVGPGSVIDGRAYQIEVDAPIRLAPAGLVSKLRPPRERRPFAMAAAEDTPAAIAAAVSYLTDRAPVAVQGQGGDNTTYQVAAALCRDYGLTQETATDLMAEHWNERCSPPWAIDALAVKVANAAEYGTGDVGIKAPDRIYKNVTVPAPVYVSQEARARGVFDFGNMPAENEIPPRQWVMGRWYLPRYTTAVIGNGAAGKSLIGLITAAHLAAGVPFGNHHVPVRRPSIIINAEDDRAEMTQRLRATCEFYKFDFEDVKRYIALVPGDELGFMLTQGRDAEPNVDMISTVVEVARQNSVGMIWIDPIIEMHESEENDPTAMRKVFGAARWIAREADAAVAITMHTPKGVYDPGSIEAARGTGAVGNVVRIAKTIFTASEEDVVDFGIPAEERKMYVRVDDAKFNLFAPNTTPTWFRRTGIKLSNGEDYPTLAPIDGTMVKTQALLKTRMDIVRFMKATERAFVPMANLIDYFAMQDPLFGSMDKTEQHTFKQRLRTSIVRAVPAGTPFAIEGYGTLEMVAETAGTTKMNTGVRLT